MQHITELEEEELEEEAGAEDADDTLEGRDMGYEYVWVDADERPSVAVAAGGQILGHESVVSCI